MMSIRVFIVEDQALVLGALANLLGMEPDIQIVGQAKNGVDALRQLEDMEADILLTDIEMPEMDGLELAQTVAEKGMPCKVVVLTTFARTGFLQRALKSGIDGFLLKDMPAEKLAIELRRISRGERVIDAELMLEAWQEKDPLTERERDVLRQAAQGKTTAEIAASTFLSIGTVRNYLSEAIHKLQSRNRVEAARIAKLKGWI